MSTLFESLTVLACLGLFGSLFAALLAPRPFEPFLASGLFALLLALSLVASSRSRPPS